MNEVDAIRIEQFRQFKKQIRGSREYEVVGIDVAKEKHHAFFGTATGKTLLRNPVIGNDLQGFCKIDAIRVFQ
jgi:transposase